MWLLPQRFRQRRKSIMNSATGKVAFCVVGDDLNGVLLTRHHEIPVWLKVKLTNVLFRVWIEFGVARIGDDFFTVDPYCDSANAAPATGKMESQLSVVRFRRLQLHRGIKFDIFECLDFAWRLLVESRDFCEESRIVITILQLAEIDELIAHDPVHQFHSAGRSIETSFRGNRSPIHVVQRNQACQLLARGDVPEFDPRIPTSADYDPAVRTKNDGEGRTGMAHQRVQFTTRFHVPKFESAVEAPAGQDLAIATYRDGSDRIGMST